MPIASIARIITAGNRVAVNPHRSQRSAVALNSS